MLTYDTYCSLICTYTTVITYTPSSAPYSVYNVQTTITHHIYTRNRHTGKSTHVECSPTTHTALSYAHIPQSSHIHRVVLHTVYIMYKRPLHTIYILVTDILVSLHMSNAHLPHI